MLLSENPVWLLINGTNEGAKQISLCRHAAIQRDRGYTDATQHALNHELAFKRHSESLTGPYTLF